MLGKSVLLYEFAQLIYRYYNLYCAGGKVAAPTAMPDYFHSPYSSFRELSGQVKLMIPFFQPTPIRPP